MEEMEAMEAAALAAVSVEMEDLEALAVSDPTGQAVPTGQVVPMDPMDPRDQMDRTDLRDHPAVWVRSAREEEPQENRSIRMAIALAPAAVSESVPVSIVRITREPTRAPTRRQRPVFLGPFHIIQVSPPTISLRLESKI